MGAPTTRPTWGWNLPARVVLTAVAASGGLGLLAAPRSPGTEGRALPALVVDPNTAPPAVLAALPRLGPSLVHRIVAARDESPFQSLDDLDARVRGIGPTTVTALRPYLRVGANGD
jgi:competence protein ComEA